MWESKVAPLSGVLFGLLLVVSYLVDSNTQFMPTAEEVVRYLEGGPMSVMAGAYLRILAAAALVWFGGSLYKVLKGADDDDGRLSALTLAGAVVAASMIIVGALTIFAAAERIWMVGGIDAGSAAGLFDLAGIATGNGATIGFATMIGATGIAFLRAPEPRRIAGWSSVALGLALISPYAWLFLVLVLVWVPVAGVWIYRREQTTSDVTVSV